MQEYASIALDGGNPEREQVKQAYEHVGTALEALYVSDNFDRFCALQTAYFRLKAALRAMNAEFQQMELDGTRLHVPHASAVFDPTTAEDKHGEWEFPTRWDSYRVLDGIEVCKPNNPHTTMAVHVDHRISPKGEVTVEINGTKLADLGK